MHSAYLDIEADDVALPLVTRRESPPERPPLRPRLVRAVGWLLVGATLFLGGRIMSLALVRTAVLEWASFGHVSAVLGAKEQIVETIDRAAPRR